MCGESAAVEFVRELMYTTGEEVEVRLERVVRQALHCLLVSLSFFYLFVFVSTVGPHIRATNSFHCLRPGCGVIRQPPTRRLHRVFQ